MQYINQGVYGKIVKGYKVLSTLAKPIRHLASWERVRRRFAQKTVERRGCFLRLTPSSLRVVFKGVWSM